MLLRYTAYDLNNSLNVAAKISDITTGTPGAPTTTAMANWLNGTYYLVFNPTPGHKYVINMMVYTDNTFATPLTTYTPADDYYEDTSVIPQNIGLNDFEFPMQDTSGNPLTGLTVTAKRSIDGASFGLCTNSVVEVGLGWYRINLSAADLNGKVIALNFTATGALPSKATLVTS